MWNKCFKQDLIAHSQNLTNPFYLSSILGNPCVHLLLLDILTQRCNDKLISVKNLFPELLHINCWLFNCRVPQLSGSLYQILYELRASHFFNQTG